MKVQKRRKSSKTRPAIKSLGKLAEPESRVCVRYHHAVELIGRRWTGAIISLLMRGPQGFNEMLTAVPGLSDRLLTERLRELESEGLVLRIVLPGPPVRVSYELTDAGKDLKPVIECLGRWAEHWIKAE
jgi:DNA-binding HxlR family transcriptional regulator